MPGSTVPTITSGCSTAFVPLAPATTRSAAPAFRDLQTTPTNFISSSPCAVCACVILCKHHLSVIASVFTSLSCFCSRLHLSSCASSCRHTSNKPSIGPHDQGHSSRHHHPLSLPEHDNSPRPTLTSNYPKECNRTPLDLPPHQHPSINYDAETGHDRLRAHRAGRTV